MSLAEDMCVFPLNDKNEPSFPEEIAPELLSPFTHEYLHYIHNISTIEGIRAFISIVKLMNFIPELIGEDLSLSGNLSDAQLNQYHATIREFLDHRGDCKIDKNVILGNAPTIRVVDVRRSNDSVCLDVDFDVMTQTGLPQTAKYRFGGVALMEGIAYELDRLVELGPNADSNSGDNASPFPYLVLRRVGCALAGSIHRCTLVSLAILALQTKSPAHCFQEFCKRYREALPTPEGSPPPAEKVKEFLNILIDDTKGNREDAFDALLVPLEEIKNKLSGRGPVGAGFTFVIDTIHTAIERRKLLPLFEMEPFKYNRVNVKELSDLFASLLPCDVIQRRAPEHTPKDVLISFGRENQVVEQYTYSLGVRALDAAIKFTFHHIRPERMLDTQTAGHLECPFFHCCDLPFRKESETECGMKPWALYAKYPGNACWMVSGILGTFRDYKVKKITTPGTTNSE